MTTSRTRRVEKGARLMQSGLTGTWYVVTRWVDLGFEQVSCEAKDVEKT